MLRRGVVKNLNRGYREFEVSAASQPRLLQPSHQISAAQLCPASQEAEAALAPVVGGNAKSKLRQRAAMVGWVVGLLLLGAKLNSAGSRKQRRAARRQPLQHK